MAFDPSVIGGIGASAIPDVAGAMGKAYQLKDLMDVGQMHGLQLKEMKQAQEEKEKTQKILSSVGSIDNQQKVDEVTERLRKEVGVDAAMKFHQGASQQKAADISLQMQQAELQTAQTNSILSALTPLANTLQRSGWQEGKPNPQLDALVVQQAPEIARRIKAQTPSLGPAIDQTLADPSHLTADKVMGLWKSGTDAKRELDRRKEEATISNLQSEKATREADLRIKQAKEAREAKSAVEGNLRPEDLEVAVPVVMADPSRMRDYVQWGKAGREDKKQINQAITNYLKEHNMTPGDLIVMRANAKAEMTSIPKMTQQLNAITTFEGVAKFNGDRILELIDKVGANDTQMVEAAKRYGYAKLGFADEGEMLSVLNTFQTEVARIILNPNLTGVLTDDARHEIQSVAPSGMTTAQAHRIIPRLFAEMDVRKGYIASQLDTASRTLLAPGQSVTTPPVQPPGTAPKGASVPLADYLKQQGY